MLVVDKLIYSLGMDTADFDAKAGKADAQVNKLAGSMGGKLKTAIGIVAGAFAALKLGEFAKEAALTKARTDVLGTALTQVGKSANYSQEYLDRLDRQIRALGITTQESRIGITRMIQSQLNLADAAKLARASQDLAVIAGENSSQTFERIITSISSLMPRLLRPLGVVEDLNDLYAKQATLLGKSVDELTEFEKKQSLVNAVLEAGKRVAGTYEAAMQDVGKQLTSLPRYQQEFMNALGKPFQGALSAAVSGYTNFLKGAREALLRAFDPAELLEEQITKLNSGLAGQAPKVNALISEYNSLTSSGAKSADEQVRLKEVIAELGRLVPEAVTEFGKYGDVLGINVELVKNLVKYEQDLKTEAEAKKAENVLEKIVGKKEVINDYKKDLDDLNGALGDLAGMAGKSFKSLAQSDLRKLAKNLKEDTDLFLELPNKLNKGLDQTSLAYNTVDQIYQQLKSNIEGTRDEIDKTTIRMNVAGDQLKNLERIRDRYLRRGTFEEPTPVMGYDPIKQYKELKAALDARAEAERKWLDERYQMEFEAGRVSYDDYLAWLDKKIAAEKEFSDKWIALNKDRVKTVQDAEAKFYEMASTLMGSNRLPQQTTYAPGQGKFDMFGDPVAVGEEWKRQAQDFFKSWDDYGYSSSQKLERNWLDSINAIGGAFNVLFRNIDSDVADFGNAITSAIGSFAAGGPAGIIGGVAGLLGGFINLFSSGADKIYKSQYELMQAIEDNTDAILGRTQSDIDKQAQAYADAYAIWEKHSDKGLMGRLQGSWEINDILQAAGLGKLPDDILWKDIGDYLQGILEGTEEGLGIYRQILEAQNQQDFEKLLKTPGLSYDDARKAVDYWVEMFDLTEEQQMQLLELVRDIFTQTGDWTFEQQMALLQAIEGLQDSIDNQAAADSPATQTYRSVTTITESQGNMVIGGLNTLAAIGRQGNSVMEQVREILSSGTSAISGGNTTVNIGSITINGQSVDTRSMSRQIGTEIVSQQRAVGGRTAF